MSREGLPTVRLEEVVFVAWIAGALEVLRIKHALVSARRRAQDLGSTVGLHGVELVLSEAVALPVSRIGLSLL